MWSFDLSRLIQQTPLNFSPHEKRRFFDSLLKGIARQKSPHNFSLAHEQLKVIVRA
jgi:hypothetical protein